VTAARVIKCYRFWSNNYLWTWTSSKHLEKITLYALFWKEDFFCVFVLSFRGKFPIYQEIR
jgi:hypothetical protein